MRIAIAEDAPFYAQTLQEYIRQYETEQGCKLDTVHYPSGEDLQDAFQNQFDLILLDVAMGGINSALTNLVFDMVEPQMRSNALALSQSVSGFIGFFTTLLMSGLVSHIQTNGNRFLGLDIYAQQVTSAAAFIFTMLSVLYVIIAIRPKKKTDR